MTRHWPQKGEFFLSDPLHDRRLAEGLRGVRHVFVQDLRLMARIGAYAHEQLGPQPVRIDIDLAVEDDAGLPMSRGPVGKDDLSRVVDYARIAEIARAIVAEGHVRLVETLAERIATAALSDPRVILARVRVAKPAALPDAAAVGVEVERRRAPG
jgi:7,8-dihydroneopterin aldolase/epimerase/oxygenase